MITLQEARLIPELQIKPNDLVEDCFYYKLAKAGMISEEHGQKALRRLEGRENDPCYRGAFVVADLMIENLKKYGVPCIAWMR